MGGRTVGFEPTEHDQIMMARPATPGPATLIDAITEIRELVGRRDHDALRELLLDMASADWQEHEVVDLRSRTPDSDHARPA